MGIDPDDIGGASIDVARRLRLTRLALGHHDQKAYAEAAGIEQSRYNKYEGGGRPLTLQAAMQLCETYALTLDWLYRGDPSGLPYKLATDIRNLRNRPGKH